MSEHRITCLVADDHAVLRKGLVDLLRADDGITVAGEASSGDDALALVQRRRPEVAVLDLGMPGRDGIEVCREIARVPTAVVIYTGSDDPRLVREGLDAGARGFVLKGSPPLDVVRAIRAAAAGKGFVDAVVAGGLIDDARVNGRRLSPREEQVLQLLSTGLPTAEVAGTLFLSPGTVQDYAESAIRKLGASNRVHAIAVALREGLIPGPG